MGFSLTTVPAFSVQNFKGELIECSDEKIAKHLGEVFTPRELFSDPTSDFTLTYELGDNNRLYITYITELNGQNNWVVLERK